MNVKVSFFCLLAAGNCRDRKDDKVQTRSAAGQYTAGILNPDTDEGLNSFTKYLWFWVANNGVFVKSKLVPLRLGHTVQPASWDPATLRSPAAAPGSPPRSWSRPRCVSADCGDFRPVSTGTSGPELWSCSGCGRPGETREKLLVQKAQTKRNVVLV